MPEQILGEEACLTGEEVASAAGVSTADARRLWRALGFPDVGPEVAFTPTDRQALMRLMRAVDGGTVDFDTAVQLTRAVGHTTARLADWQVGTLTPLWDEPGAPEAMVGDGVAAPDRGAGDADRRGPAADDAPGAEEGLGQVLEQLLVYAWRRHLAAAVRRTEPWGAATDEQQRTEVSVGFADLVGFTATSNQLGSEELGSMVERFESRCADVVAAGNGRVIKTLGDSVLFCCQSPEQGVDVALRVIDVIGGDPDLPDVRVGLSSGEVIMRLGDVFGPPVNMASRLTGVARRNRVITDEDTGRLLPDERFSIRPLPQRPVQGFGVLTPVAVRLRWR